VVKENGSPTASPFYPTEGKSDLSVSVTKAITIGGEKEVKGDI
jgi:hypothetical protein